METSRVGGFCWPDLTRILLKTVQSDQILKVGNEEFDHIQALWVGDSHETDLVRFLLRLGYAGLLRTR